MVLRKHIDRVLSPARREPQYARPGPYTGGVVPAPRQPVLVEVEAPTAAAGGDNLIAGEVLWPGWSLRSASGEFAALTRRDGNLVIEHCGDHAPVWQAGTGRNPGAFLEMRDDGDLCLFALTGAKAWSSGTRGKPGAFAQLGDDGVLVVYSFYRELVWSTQPA